MIKKYFYFIVNQSINNFVLSFYYLGSGYIVL